MDILRPDGPQGVLRLRGAARDLGIRSDGSPVQFNVSQVDVEIDFAQGWTVTEVESSPSVPALQELRGSRASSGFRRSMKKTLPEGDSGSLLHRLLDDVPVAAVISGYALMQEVSPALLLELSGTGGKGRQDSRTDYCAGYVSGGTMMTGVVRDGVPPRLSGPKAPELVRHSSSGAWHFMEALPMRSMRRLRRIDVSGEDELLVDAMFRDSYVDASGLETVVHEYHVDLRVRADSLEIEKLEVTPHVLPWTECPGAIAGAQRLVGRTVREIDAAVGGEFHGISSCTHLNDLLRSIADVEQLSRHLKTIETSERECH
ncbi:DUF2889 domain-containing protein [Nocardia globerula]|nr:DUF2889 domain-containing protein [Nocardia globerula]